MRTIINEPSALFDSVSARSKHSIIADLAYFADLAELAELAELADLADLAYVLIYNWFEDTP